MKITHILIFVLAVTGLSFGQTRIVNQYVSQYNRQSTSPGNPPSNTGYLYLSSSGQLTCTNSDGTSCLSAGGSAPTGAAGGDLGGTYPNPTVAKVNGSSAVGFTTSPLSQFASTTSAQLAGVISDETGSGALAFATSPTFITPALGVASATSLTSATYLTATNCSSSTSPAACSAASAGSVAVPTGTNPTLTVNTTAVTANSQIFVQSDDTLGTKLSVTCNSTLTSLAVEPVVTARTAGTSFTITVNGIISANPVCLSYFIVN